jgi:hypothetical protein
MASSPPNPLLAASSPDMTLIPSATESTFIMRGSFMCCAKVSGFFCTSESIAMKSGCAKKPRVDGSTASLPMRSGAESMAAMLPIGSSVAPVGGRSALAFAALTSSRPDFSTSDAGSIASPASYASTASLNLLRPYNAAPLREYPLGQSGLYATVFSASARALSKSPKPA